MGAVAKRTVGGFSLPVFGGGLEWNTNRPDRKTVRRLAMRLAERRVFSEIYEAEYEAYTNQSVLEIRSWLSQALTALARGSEASRLVAALREACNRYLTLRRIPTRAALPPAYGR